MKFEDSVLRKMLSPRQSASENSHMDPIASLVNKFLVATPFVVVTTLGLHASNKPKVFRYTADTLSQDQRVSDYIPVVKATEQANVKRYMLDDAQANQLADIWLSGAKSGELKPLTPISVDDSAREGVKGQIVRDCSMVAESLNFGATQRFRNGDYFGAAKEALKGAETMKVVKYFDFASMSQSSMVQRRSILLISDCEGKLKLNQLRQIQTQLVGLEDSSKELRPMVTTIRSLIAARGGSTMMLDRYLDTARIKIDAGQSKLVDSDVAIASDDSDLSDMLSDYRLGLSSSLEENRRIEALKRSI